jgi:hypothetical protein
MKNTKKQPMVDLLRYITAIKDPAQSFAKVST